MSSEEENNNNSEIASIVVVSNDNLSKKIKVSKTTHMENFFEQILNEFPDFNRKLFYYEAYSQDLFVIEKEEEYVTANKKSIEYFYLCSNDVDYKSKDEILKNYNYLKYYSVIIFSPIKVLNTEFQNIQRKKMQMNLIKNKPNNNEQNNDTNNLNDDDNNSNNNMSHSMNLNNNKLNQMMGNNNLMNPVIYNNMANSMSLNNNMAKQMMMNNSMMYPMMNYNNMMNRNMMMNNNNMMMNRNMMMNNNMLMNNNMMNNMINKNMMMNNNMMNPMMNNNMMNPMMNYNNMMNKNNMVMNNNNMMMNNNMMVNNMMNNNIMMKNNMMNNYMMNPIMNNNMMNYNNMMKNNMMMNNYMRNYPMMNNNLNMINNQMMMNNLRMNQMNNNPMINNYMFNNNMMMNNNMNDPKNIDNMKNYVFSIMEIMETNPAIGYQMIRQINPQILEQCFNVMRKNKAKEENVNKNIEIVIPEFETIDTESNPLNKYIENAINISYVMKLEILKEENSNPEKFVKITETLSSPGLLSDQQPSNDDYKYILCLVGQLLENNGIKVGIYKENDIKDRIDLSAIQFIFSGLINKKKYKLKFSDEEDKIYLCMKFNLEYRKQFIGEWKDKIANKLNIDKKLIILTNPRKEDENFFLDLAFNPEVEIEKINNINEKLIEDKIIDCRMVPLLEGCRLSPNIFDHGFNKFYNNVENNLRRGGEEYIQPLSWTAYGINISGKYDFGDNTWLGNNNVDGEFAVAYYGINNLINYNLNIIQNFMSLMGNYESGKTFINVNNIRSPGQKCKTGAYFYKNPAHAENSSESINIGGFEYKIMFMCRVKTSAIRQPENFQDCWILSPTPDEVRPYKILIKKVASALAVASQQEIKVCFGLPSPKYIEIMQQKNESFFNKNNSGINNYDFVLKSYTSSSYINNYLRENQILNNTEDDLKSYVWCLHKAISQNNQNVQNDMIVYRGVSVKIPNNIGIGSKFCFPEFLSTSKDINVAKGFAGSGTLMYITIQNNGTNGKKIYCRDVESISHYPTEREIIFTSYCHFRVTKIEKNASLDNLYLTCEGHHF